MEVGGSTELGPATRQPTTAMLILKVRLKYGTKSASSNFL